MIGDAMMAEEFGYQTSQRPASAMTSAVGEAAQAELDRAKSEKSDLPGGCAWLLLGFFIICMTVLYDDATSPMAFLFPVAGVLLLIKSVRDDIKIEKNMQATERMTAVALTSPWQVWPCRLEELPGSKGQAMMLLGPDATVVRAFSSAVPESVWVGTPDGRGVFWFAGDLRFGGLMSVPGGSLLWWARPVPTPPTLAPTDRRQEALEDAVIHQAVGFAFEEWL